MSFRLNDMIMGKNSDSKICAFTGINAHAASIDLTRPIVLSVLIGEAKEIGNKTNQSTVQPRSMVTRIQRSQIEGTIKANQLASYLNSFVIRFIKVLDKASLILPVYFGIPVNSNRIPNMIKRSQIRLFKIMKFHAKGK